MEFMPKTLADLHVDAIPTSDAMNGGNFSLHGKTHFAHTHTKTIILAGGLAVCFLSLLLCNVSMRPVTIHSSHIVVLSFK